MQTTQLGKVFGSVGAVGGLMWSLGKKKSTGKVILFTAIFGIAGLVVGNAITKFYE